MIDIGVNLTSSRFGADWRSVADAARRAGVETLILTGTDAEDSRQALAMAAALDLHCTAGVHPHQAAGWSADTEPRLRQLLAERRVCAVGECGLDFFRDLSPRAQQENVFLAQIALALEFDRPLFLHCRDAHARFAELLRPYAGRVRGVAHCFTGTAAELEQCLELGLHIGITGWICDERRGQELRALVPRIPLDRLLLETDAPYLLPRDLPQPPVSRRNEPKFLPHIAASVAGLYGLSLDTIVMHSGDNARRLFALEKESA
jgi:TatD DNase family protein